MRSKLITRGGLALLMGMTALVALPSASRAKAGPANNDPAKLAIYQFNIHLMENDWQGWVQHIKLSPDLPVPDVITVQDLPSESGRQAFQDYLSSVEGFGETFYGRASTNPDNGNQRAVIWRANRLGNVSSRTFNGWGGTDCTANANNANTVQVRLQDKLDTSKWISVVSFKTPPKVTDACPWKNTKLMNDKLRESGWSGNLLLMGTDANATDWNSSNSSWRCWYSGTNGSLSSGCPDGDSTNRGYRDPIFARCAGSSSCTTAEVTLPGVGRVDYILARTGAGGMPNTENAKTLPRGNLNCSNSDPLNECWSDHHSVHAFIRY